MDDPNLPDDQPPTQPNDVSLGGLQIGSQIGTDLISLILSMQANPLDSSTEQINRGSWTQQEDDLLIGAVEQLGPKKWTDISKFVPSRTSKQCRERWFNRLAPDLKHEPFEPWEDKIIVQKQKEIGNRWAIIARELPGRSTNSIKNRWYSGLKTQREISAQINMNTNDLMVQQMTVDMMQQHVPSDIMMTGQDLNMGVTPDHESNPTNTDL